MQSIMRRGKCPGPFADHPGQDCIDIPRCGPPRGRDARVLGLGTEGTVMTVAEFRALRRTFAAEIRNGVSRKTDPVDGPARPGIRNP